MARRTLGLSVVGALAMMVLAIAGAPGTAQTQNLGVFMNQGSVGQTPPGGNAIYDAAKGEYRITGGGANIWYDSDAFYFVWKQTSGDISLTADVQWVGTSAVEHRKAVLMIRQSLEPGSAYADAVSHGNGLTSLQFRGAANERLARRAPHRVGEAARPAAGAKLVGVLAEALRAGATREDGHRRRGVID